MATTRLMPLHTGKGRNLSTAIADIIDYVKNPQKTDFGKFIYGYECDTRIADAEFLLSKRQYASLTGRNRGSDDVIAYHLRQAFKPGEVTPEEANQIGRELAMKLTKGNHAFIVCTHVDKHHVHNHVIINSTTTDCTHKFRNFWGSTWAIRRMNDKLCLEHGLSVIENPKPSRDHYGTWMGDKKQPSYHAQLRIAIDAALEEGPKDFSDFLKKLEAAGIEVNQERKHLRFRVPGQENYTRLYACTDTAGQELLYRSRSRAAPFLVEVDRDMTALGIPCYAASRRYAAAPLCPQLLGYLDGEGHGAAGLEKALDALLTGSGARDTLLCPVTAQGTLRTGEQVQHLQADSGAVGVRLTLSRSVQRAAEAVAAQTMTTGCILVLDVRTAALRACVSVPGFDPADPAASLEAPDSPFLNRALQAYAVGSVFKPVLAAAALEAGLAPEHDCNGAVVVDGQIFRCAGGVPHGEVDLSAALAKSCNGYFIRLGQQLGAQALLQQAQALGFGRSIGLAEGLTAQSGALPGAEELAQSGQLANFSFGQGSLLATPLQVAAMMNTIANGGVYRAPCLLDCALDETSGEDLSAFARPQAERVLTEQTAAALRTMLEQTVAEGTAQDASGLPGGAAGKTGTAQTGQFTAEGKERMNLWFAGFYPAEDPQYTIVVLQDGQTQAAVSSAAVFAQLCTALHWLG